MLICCFVLRFGYLNWFCVVFGGKQRNLDQLEALSKKLKAKTLRAEAPAQSIAATRYIIVLFNSMHFASLFALYVN